MKRFNGQGGLRAFARASYCCVLFGLGACGSGGGDDGAPPQPPPPPPATNSPPTANAGPDQVVQSAAAVTLSATASIDSDGSIATYAWTQTSGTPVTLSAANAATVSFTAPSPGALAFQVTVTDNGGASHSDTVSVTVNAAPVANAGADQAVSAGAAVSLGGAGSDGDGTIASYAWTQTSGDAVTLSGASTATATFTAPAAAASLAFTLTVTDNHGASHADSVTVTVAAPPAPPPAPPPPPSSSPISTPVIGRQPTSPKAFEHGSALIFVVASGGGLNYEWRSSGGTVVKSGPEPWLMRNGLNMADDGRCYHVVITNSFGTVTSNPGCLTVRALTRDLDPHRDHEDSVDEGIDDRIYAQDYSNALMAAATVVAGHLTEWNHQMFEAMLGGALGTFTIATRQATPGSGCGGNSTTVDGVPVTASGLVPFTGRHWVSDRWYDACYNQDEPWHRDGGILIDYDFPHRHGEGTLTIYLSGFAFGTRGAGTVLNGILQAIVTSPGIDTPASPREDRFDITVLEGFSSRGVRVTPSLAPHTISIIRKYSTDRTRVDETTIDFDVPMHAFDIEGSAGAIALAGPGHIVLRWLADLGNGTPGYTSISEKAVRNETFHLATVQAGLVEQTSLFGPPEGEGWLFNALAPEECPEDYTCADPATP